ncbi:predicted protein [Scheffersomyces stipitis CBS 6054]|uniref:RRM domain-containing protein n=1 Tax=Scheffersomyces stipitis (strain ATCC 58785 / CBS 6054 / NBRC 10063 / NRRL Y-11545) TaxID=322104 RepID=A3LPJ8_PICST|nr:predicted protein [Scheffersomyces stipitis CBS 6054]ABN64508.1 predicted protein [Scheffersomyces stipitis CBS 6054]KAG2736842.1 hypothetical protein G9P44_000932 [Scheffersomyces stipitis]
MSDILEKSLDEIIGENKSSRRPHRRSGGPSRRGNQSRIQKTPYTRERPTNSHSNYRPSSSSSLPGYIREMSHSRPVLRVKNIHPDLNGEDLSNLFGNISAVEFVKFDNRDDSVAYVCFETDNTRSNAAAIEKYNGKKAMGNVLVVESATSLADRISGLPTNTRIIRGKNGPAPGGRERKIGQTPGGRERKKKEPRPKHVKKSAEDLDNELTAYMNNGGDSGATESAETDSQNIDQSMKD